jgi:methanogenic corrinoid protein MtbC1
MLSWCSYCQQFLGEVPPYEDFIITHGICGDCESSALTLTESDMAHALRLRAIQSRLFDAGRRGDLKAARLIIETARRAGTREVDIVIGVIAPMLYRIGEDWKCGVITVAEEHRFTAFCEKILDIVTANTLRLIALDADQEKRGQILLINAPGNHHTLAVRILALWLSDKGMPAHAVDDALDVNDLIVVILKMRPRILLISMALAEQVPGVTALVDRIADLPEPLRPKIVVGGYAVKLGLVSHIPGAILLADINGFAALLA